MLLYNPKVSEHIDFLKKYLDVTITHSLDEYENFKGLKFFVITISDIWLANNTNTNTNNIDWLTVFDAKILENVRNYKVLFDISYESCTKPTIDTILDFCKYTSISPTDTYISISNSATAKLNVDLKKFNIFSFERHEHDAVQVGYSMQDSIYKFKFPKHKRFLFINRRYSLDRAYLYFKFRQNNLLDEMHCTFRLDKVYNNTDVSIQDIVADLKNVYADSSLINDIVKNEDSILKSLPHKVESSIYQEDYKKSFLYSTWNIAAHNSTDINIITETYGHHYETMGFNHYQTLYFITEKTYRTILMKQPFILFSNPYALKHLKESGYKTFSPFIDESYDNIENLRDRQEAIVNEVTRLKNMSHNEFEELVVKCKEIADYNYSILMNKVEDKYRNTYWSNDDIKPYFKGIDKTLKLSTMIKWYNK
jgi:hypothetical protein